MADDSNWSFPAELQPDFDDVDFDLKAALDAVVSLRADIPEDAFTASILGTERAGNGVVIGDDGLVLTIGYLITEAQSIWITTNNGTAVSGHPLAYDQSTGFGLVLPLGRLGAKAIARGTSSAVAVDDEVFVIGAGGRRHAMKASLIAKREFAGYWEYVLDEALFTAPPHPAWSGAALVDAAGSLVGIGSLFVQEMIDDKAVEGNMFVPIDLLQPIIVPMVNTGRSGQPPRAWLGLYAVATDKGVTISGLVKDGPAYQAGVRLGDIVIEAAGERVNDLAALFRNIWRQGPAGTQIALRISQNGRLADVRVHSADRNDFLKKPLLQ